MTDPTETAAPAGGGFDAVVLAGGAARRLGGADKPALRLDEHTLLEHVLAAVAGADRIVVVGPRRRLSASVPPVVWAQESPPGGGPVAAVAAGLAATRSQVVLLLAADLPAIGGAVAPLRAALRGPGRAVLVDRDGRVNQLAAAWRRPDLAAALAALPAVEGAAMRALAAGVPTVEVVDTQGWGQDCDTWDDVAAARAAAAGPGQASRSSPA